MIVALILPVSSPSLAIMANNASHIFLWIVATDTCWGHPSGYVFWNGQSQRHEHICTHQSGVCVDDRDVAIVGGVHPVLQHHLTVDWRRWRRHHPPLLLLRVRGHGTVLLGLVLREGLAEALHRGFLIGPHPDMVALEDVDPHELLIVDVSGDGLLQAVDDGHHRLVVIADAKEELPVLGTKTVVVACKVLVVHLILVVARHQALQVAARGPF